MKKSIVFFLALLFISACSYGERTITDKSNSISVTKPALWFNIDSLNDDADIKIGNTIFEAYFIAIAENIKDFPQGYTLEQYSELTRGMIKQGAKDITENEDLSFTKINGMAARKYVLNATVSGIKIKYWHVTVKSNKRFYQLLTWSLPSRFESNKKNFEKVLLSFSEI